MLERSFLIISLTVEREGRLKVRSCLNQKVLSCNMLYLIDGYYIRKHLLHFMFVTGKTLEFECRSRKIMSRRLNPHWMLGTDVIQKIVDIRTCRPNRSLVLTSLWKHSSALCTHLCFQVTVLSFLLLFLCPCLSHTRADTDQSPWLYLRCVLWQNRGKWQRRWRRRRVPAAQSKQAAPRRWSSLW